MGRTPEGERDLGTEADLSFPETIVSFRLDGGEAAGIALRGKSPY